MAEPVQPGQRDPRPRTVARLGEEEKGERRRSLSRGVTLAGFHDLASELLLNPNVPKPVGERVLTNVEPPESRELTPNFLFSVDGKPNLTILRSHFMREGRLSIESALALCNEAKAILRQEENVLQIQAPVVVFGDIHGQFYDFVQLLDKAKEHGQMLFMGDYVDRGDFSTEVLFYLLAMKICEPTKVWLLRGNHETRMMAEFMTFQLECEYKYGSEELYNACTTLFDTLPLAAVLSGCPEVGRMLCVHGGLSPDIHYLKDIEQLDRFQEPPSSGPLCDLLWSDPLDPPEKPSKRELEAWMGVQFAPNNLRQTSFYYGLAAVKKFLADNDLACIVRGHQVVDAGYKEHKYLQSVTVPYVITVFSAPNYCDMYANRGAALKLDPKEGISYLQIENVPHPYFLPDFADVFSWSIPYLMESLVTMLSEMVISIKEENMSDITAEKRKRDAMLAEKMAAIKTHLSEVERKQERVSQNRQELLASDHPNMSKFQAALQMDAANEQCPTPIKRKNRALVRRATEGGLMLSGFSSQTPDRTLQLSPFSSNQHTVLFSQLPHTSDGPLPYMQGITLLREQRLESAREPPAGALGSLLFQ